MAHGVLLGQGTSHLYIPLFLEYNYHVQGYIIFQNGCWRSFIQEERQGVVLE